MNFLTYALLTTITPGPNNIMSMSNGSRLGIRKSLPFNLGVFTGFSIVMIICTLFVTLLRRILPTVKMPMLILGAAYMVWLAWKTYNRPATITEDDRGSSYLSGMLFQFINPKIYLYGIVSMEVYVLPHYADQPAALLFFAVLLAFIGSSCNIAWLTFGSVFKAYYARHYKAINLVMAILLLYCAVALFR